MRKIYIHERKRYELGNQMDHKGMKDEVETRGHGPGAYETRQAVREKRSETWK